MITDKEAKSSRILVEPHLVGAECCKAWMPYSCGSGHPVVTVEQFLKFVDLLGGQDLFEVAKGERSTAGGLDGWAWNEVKALPPVCFSGLAVLLSTVEPTGVWPRELLDAFFAMIPKVHGDFTPLGQRPLCVLQVFERLWTSLRLTHLKDWVKSWVPESVFSLGNGVSSVEAWFLTALDIEEVLSGACDDQLHVDDVIESFDTVDRSILDCALGRLALHHWFRKVYFACHSQDRLRFKLAAGLECRDGGIPQGCPLSLFFFWP